MNKVAGAAVPNNGATRTTADRVELNPKTWKQHRGCFFHRFRGPVARLDFGTYGLRWRRSFRAPFPLKNPISDSDPAPQRALFLRHFPVATRPVSFKAP